MKQVILSLFILVALKVSAQKPENWTKDQLIEPASLAQTIQAGKNLPLIYCVGPGALIPHSIDIGMVKEDSNLTRFKKDLTRHPKNAEIVIYCGCCPFEHCPNVRPAIQALKDMGYTNYKLLDLPHNLKTDWISKSYPVVKQ